MSKISEKPYKAQEPESSAVYAPEGREDRAAAAEREVLAQLAIIRAVRKLQDKHRQERVLCAVSLLIAADEYVPGVLSALAGAMAAQER